MELREFVKIFIIYKKLFWGIIVICLIIGMSFYIFQKETYKVTILLNITREQSGIDEYSYDSFYRLQADEKFGDTIVAWMKSLTKESEIYDESNIVKEIKAHRMSAQVVSVLFVTALKKDAHVISTKLLKYLNNQSQKLNEKQNQDNWFLIIGSDPVITDNGKSLTFVMLGSLFCGVFIAFWSVMMAHYIVDDK